MKKIGILFLCVCLLTGITALPAMAEITQTVWDGFDANAVKTGESDYWTCGGVDLYSDENVTGLVAFENTSGATMSSNDSAFPSTSKKREWGWMKAKNAITSEDALRYEISFDMNIVEGAYAAPQAGTYIVLRSDTFSNYLDNRLMLMIKRNQVGDSRIALKSAAQGVNSGELVITNENVTLIDTTIKIVDNFYTDIIKVYATDTEGEYQLIGTVALDRATNSATLTNAAGTTQTRTGYAAAISETSATPGFIFVENAQVISDVKVTYPIPGPVGVSVNKTSGIYAGDPEIELSTTDAEGVIYYTLDGTDPIENGIEYQGGALDLSGVELHGTVTLKVTEKLMDEYSDVATYEYTIYPESESYTLVPSEVNDKTSADFEYGNSFVMGTITNENDGFTTGNSIHSWSRVYSKFVVPTVAGGMEYNFKMKNLGIEGGMMYGVFVSLNAATTEQMTSTTVPYLYLNRKGIGFRDNTTWGASASRIIDYGDGITFEENTFDVRIINRFDGESEIYFGNQLVAKVTIKNGVMTLTNTDGESISREGVVTATDYAYANLALYRGSNTVTIADFTVSYPAGDKAYATAEIDDAEGYVGAEMEVGVSCDDADATVYYTTDGTLPDKNSSMCDGYIVLDSPESAQDITLKVRAFNGTYWGTTDTATVSFKVPAKVEMTPVAGSYAGVPEITLGTEDEAAEVYYTLDGSDPTDSEGTRIKYTEGAIDLSAIEGNTFEIKAVGVVNGVYGEVSTGVYNICPESATYKLVTSEVSEGTSADFGYNNKFVMHGDNGFAAENTINSWTHVYSKFGIPVDAGGMEYRFKAENMSADGATHFGMFVSLQSPQATNMVSNTVPYIYLGVDKIGFRNANSWGSGASTTIGYAAGVTFDSGLHDVRIVNKFNGTTEVYIDTILVATVTISNGTMTVTNGDGVSITREGVVPATDLVYANLAIYKGSQYTIVRDFTVLYPDTDAVYPTASVITEIPELTVGDGLILEVEATEGAEVYYTLDGSEPDGNSAVYENGISVTSPETEGTVTVKVKACKDGLWGVTETVVLEYNKAILRGDADLDGKISVYDAVFVLKMIAGTVESAEDSVKAVDFDGDGIVVVTDAIAILKYIARITDTL